jgi:peptide/nickel transport system permease protein
MTTAINGVRRSPSGARRPWNISPFALISAAFLALLILAAIFAPLIAPYSPISNDLHAAYSLPSSHHLLGTDNLGRDILSRVIYGGRISLVGVAQALVVYLTLGATFGVLAGYLGGFLDTAVVWVADVSFALPQIIVVLSVLAIFSNNTSAAMLALGLLGAPGLAVFVRGATRIVRAEPYIAAARVSGLRTRSLLRRHVFPQITAPIIVQTSLFAGTALLFQTGMDFLGLGTQPPNPSWGGMVAEASTFMSRDIWMLMPPGVAVVLAIVAFGLVGDGAQDLIGRVKGQGPRRLTLGAGSTTSSTMVSSDPAPDAAELALAELIVASDEHPVDVVDRTDSAIYDTADDRASVPEPSDAVLIVRDLFVSVAEGGPSIVQHVTFALRPGECLGIVGESGCGKTMTALALIGLLPEGVYATGGSIDFQGTELRGMSEGDYRKVRGAGIAMISQEPIASLDPSFSVGDQVAEVLRRHAKMTRRAARAEALHLLEQVKIPNPSMVARRFPHQLSGGMAQRVSIAAALAARPKVLIADEPTTALDVTVQAEILQLLRGLREEMGLAVILVSHDWGVIADSCDAAIVMYAGQVVEEAPINAVFEEPRHPYSYGLMESNPYFATAPGSLLPALPGTVPSIGQWPAGCHFAARCQFATPECSIAPIALERVQADHWSRCIHIDKVVEKTKAGRP